MAPKKSKTIKTKAKRVFASSSKPAIVFDQITFETVTNEQRSLESSIPISVFVLMIYWVLGFEVKVLS